MAALTALILGTLAAAQTAKSVVDDRNAARGARKTANFQAGTLEQQAQDSITIGNEAASYTESQGRQLASSQRVSFGAQGIDASSGSAADVIANDQREAALGAQRERNNAARDALNYRKQAQLVRMGGANQAQGYKNAATGSLLSGAASLYGIYNAYGKTAGSTPRRASGGGGSPSSGSGGPLDPFA